MLPKFTHPIQPTLLLLSFLYIVNSTVNWDFWCIGIGILAWTFLEYCLHRFLFHLSHKISEPWNTLFLDIPTKHHLTPESLDSQFTPVSWVILFVGLSMVFCYFKFIVPLSLLTGMLIGYIIYEWDHWKTHHYESNLCFIKYMKRYHNFHHYISPNKNYGITSPFWDVVFRTYQPID